MPIPHIRQSADDSATSATLPRNGTWKYTRRTVIATSAGAIAATEGEYDHMWGQDASVMYGYTVAQGLVHVLKQCGDDLTRANVMKQAANTVAEVTAGRFILGLGVSHAVMVEGLRKEADPSKDIPFREVRR